MVVQKYPVKVSSTKRQSQDNLEAGQALVLSSIFLSSYREKSITVPWIKRHLRGLSHSNSLRAAMTTASLFARFSPLIFHAKQGVPTLPGQGKSQKTTPDCW